MPMGEVHMGYKGELLDSLPTPDNEAGNVLSSTLGPRSWTLAGMTATSDFHEAKKAGSGVPTMREFVNANQALGLCVKQVSSCCRACLE